MSKSAYADRFMLKLLLLLIVGLLPQIAWGDVENDPEKFSKSSCPAYADFLIGEEVEPQPGCNKAENFVIIHAGDPDWEFFTKYEEIPAGQSVVTYLLRARAASEVASPRVSYEESDLADRLSFSTFDRANDFERSVTYSAVLSELKVEAILEMCKTSSLCHSLEPFSTFSNLLGEKYSYLDGIPSKVLLRCLLKADGFSTPIKVVLQSARALSCFKGTVR